MATDYFAGWTIARKSDMLTSLQEANLTGQVVKLQTAHGVYTEFAPTNISLQIDRLEYSIANDPLFDPDNPVCAACAANVRTGVTPQSHY